MSVSSSTHTQGPLPQQEPLDKTLIAGSVVTGVLFGVPAGIAFATGYLASKNKVFSRWDRIASFLGKAAAPIATLAKIKSLTNLELSLSSQTQIQQASSVIAETERERSRDYQTLIKACSDIYPQTGKVSFLFSHCMEWVRGKFEKSGRTFHRVSKDNNIDKDCYCQKACDSFESLDIPRRNLILTQKSLIDPISPIIHARQSAIALSTGVLGLCSVCYSIYRLTKAKNYWEATRWWIGMTLSILAFTWPQEKFNNSRLAQVTGMTASIYSAYKTATSLKNNKLLKALQWFSISMCSSTLAYAASQTPNF